MLCVGICLVFLYFLELLYPFAPTLLVLHLQFHYAKSQDQEMQLCVDFEGGRIC